MQLIWLLSEAHEHACMCAQVLGRHLAALPLPPRIGKMLLYGCLDPILTVTCCMAYRCGPPLCQG